MQRILITLAMTIATAATVTLGARAASSNSHWDSGTTPNQTMDAGAATPTQTYDAAASSQWDSGAASSQWDM